MLFPALSSIFKERLFADAADKLDGRRLDLFAVNSFGSGAQCLFVLLLLPVLSSQRGIPFSQLPHYLAEGAPPRLLSPFTSSSHASGVLAPPVGSQQTNWLARQPSGLLPIAGMCQQTLLLSSRG